MRVCIVIPAYEPGGEFVPYAQEVLAAGLGPVLVVDDGSGPAYAPVFAALAEMGCTVLTHEQNRGKGAALKTALRWYGAHEDGCAGIVTADCDGQHTVKDVRRVCEAMEACPGTLVLGCRDFGPGTPARSATGNRVTSAAMRVLYNIDLKDTQTGLRGIPNGMHRDLLEVRGERYEYELNMLIYAKQRSIPYTIVPIETVYFNNNEGSHYRTVADSARIIHQLGSGLVQYAMSAGLSVVVDVFVYCVLVKWLLLGLPLAPRLFFAAVIARTLSSVVNYTCNRRLPYVQNKKIGPTVAKYYCLWLAQLMLSFVGVWAACTGLHMDDMLAKLLVDALLAVASYQVQLRWVFSEKTPRPVLYGSGEAMDAKRTTAQGGFAQRNAAPDFARQTQKAGPVTGQRGFAQRNGAERRQAPPCSMRDKRPRGGRGAASGACGRKQKGDAGMTLGEAKSEVLKLLDETKPKADLTGRLDRFFDMGQKEVALYYPIWREKTYAAEDEKTLPQDCCKPRYVIVDGIAHPYTKYSQLPDAFTLRYEAYPADIPDNAPDETEFDLPDEAVLAVIFFAAAQTQSMEYDQRFFQSFYAQYQGKLSNLSGQADGPAAVVTGGCNV